MVLDVLIGLPGSLLLLLLLLLVLLPLLWLVLLRFVLRFEPLLLCATGKRCP